MPEFDGSKESYVVATTNATNKITAEPSRVDANIRLYVNGLAHTNETNATWLVGKNDLTVRVNYGTTEKVYNVLVTKSGTIGTLTVASAPGEATGDTTITVTESLTDGLKYKYKSDTTVDLPELDADLSTWTDWDGESDITAEDGDEIVIATVNYKNLVKAVGKATVDSVE